MDEFLTVKEVAERLRLHPQTVRNMIDRGELTGTRVGARRVLVSEPDLEQFLSEGRRITRKSPGRVAFEEASKTAMKAIRSRDPEAPSALRSLSDAALHLADEL